MYYLVASSECKIVNGLYVLYEEYTITNRTNAIVSEYSLYLLERIVYQSKRKRDVIKYAFLLGYKL